MALVRDALMPARASKFLGLHGADAQHGLLAAIFSRDSRNFLRRFALIRITLAVLHVHPDVRACMGCLVPARVPPLWGICSWPAVPAVQAPGGGQPRLDRAVPHAGQGRRRRGGQPQPAPAAQHPQRGPAAAPPELACLSFITYAGLMWCTIALRRSTCMCCKASGCSCARTKRRRGESRSSSPDGFNPPVHQVAAEMLVVSP